MTEYSEEVLEEMGYEISNIHQETNIDGWGDEGAGYDYTKQARLLIEAGWTPPTHYTEED